MAKKTDYFMGNTVDDEVLNANFNEEINEDKNKNLKESETQKSESLSSEEIVHNHSTLDYVSRGFMSEKEARDFIKTDYFKNLGKADQEEFMAWLKK